MKKNIYLAPGSAIAQTSRKAAVNMAVLQT